MAAGRRSIWGRVSLSPAPRRPIAVGGRVVTVWRRFGSAGYITAVMAAIWFAIQIQRFSLAVYVGASTLMPDLGITAAAAGFLASIYFPVYGLVQIPSGILADQGNPRLNILVASLVTTVAALAFAFAPGLEAAVAARVVVGAGSGFLWMSQLKLLRQLSSRKYAGRMGLITLVGSFGNILVLGGLPLLLVFVHWRPAAALLAVPTLLTALTLLAADTPRSESVSGRILLSRSLRTLARVPVILGGVEYWRVFLVNMFWMGSHFAVVTWLPRYARDALALPPTALGLLPAIVPIGQIVGTALASRAIALRPATAVPIFIGTCAGYVIVLAALASGSAASLGTRRSSRSRSGSECCSGRSSSRSRGSAGSSTGADGNGDRYDERHGVHPGVLPAVADGRTARRGRSPDVRDLALLGRRVRHRVRAARRGPAGRARRVDAGRRLRAAAVVGERGCGSGIARKSGNGSRLLPYGRFVGYACLARGLGGGQAPALRDVRLQIQVAARDAVAEVEADDGGDALDRGRLALDLDEAAERKLVEADRRAVETPGLAVLLVACADVVADSFEDLAGVLEVRHLDLDLAADLEPGVGRAIGDRLLERQPSAAVAAQAEQRPEARSEPAGSSNTRFDSWLASTCSAPHSRSRSRSGAKSATRSLTSISCW